MHENNEIVKNAGLAFMRGDYELARKLYQDAADRYGRKLFEANLFLCERRLGCENHLAGEKGHGVDVSAEKNQLKETQQLLEYYYSRAQDFENQLTAIKLPQEGKE